MKKFIAVILLALTTSVFAASNGNMRQTGSGNNEEMMKARICQSLVNKIAEYPDEPTAMEDFMAYMATVEDRDQYQWYVDLVGAMMKVYFQMPEDGPFQSYVLCQKGMQL